MGVDRDVMFDRLVTRAGMQMPIVRTIAKDLVHGTASASSYAFLRLLFALVYVE